MLSTQHQMAKIQSLQLLKKTVENPGIKKNTLEVGGDQNRAKNKSDYWSILVEIHQKQACQLDV